MTSAPKKRLNPGEQKALDAKLVLNDFPYIDSMRKSLEAGANPHGGDAPESDTLLHYAVFRNDEDMVALLLEHGANPHVVGRHKRTPLQSISPSTEKGIAQRLILAGKDRQARDPSGWSNFDHACKIGLLDVAKSLHAQGSDPRGINHEGLEPIHLAALNGHTEVCRFLLELGVDPNSPTHPPKTTPVAKKAKNPSQTPVFSPSSPLIEAAKNGRQEVCLLLLQSGADANFKHKRSTAASWAKKSDFPDTASAIQACCASEAAKRAMECAVALPSLLKGIAP